jgi:DNA-binding XRE family transcriptional regulator
MRKKKANELEEEKKIASIKAILLKAGRPDLARLLDTPEKPIKWGELRDLITTTMPTKSTNSETNTVFYNLINTALREVETEMQARSEPLDPSSEVTRETLNRLFSKLIEVIQEIAKELNKISSPLTTGPQRTEYLEVLSSHLYHNLRSAFATRKFLIPKEERWPVADLSGANKKLHASAQLRPNPKEVEPYLSTDELTLWREKMAKHMSTMDDLTADVFDIISAAWLKRAEHPEAMVTVTADEFLQYRGLQPKTSGTGRRGGYKKMQRQEIAHHIAILASTWVTVFTMDVTQENEKGRWQRTKWRGESRAVVVTSQFGQEQKTGNELDVYAWRVRPGDVFAKFLFGPGRQTALLSRRAVEYDPYRQKWEKRLTRYLSWQWRIRQNGGTYLEPISVEKLLETVGENVDTKNPVRTKERLEKALDTLQEDGIITSWQYETAKEETVGQPGWWKEWLDWKIIVEPPQNLMEYYAKIPQLSTKALPSAKPNQMLDLGESLKKARKDQGLTLMQAAEEIGISPSRLSEIENGKKATVSKDTRRKILKWLHEVE